MSIERVRLDDVEGVGNSELKARPSLVLVDSSLSEEGKGALLDGLGLNDFGGRAISDEGFIEIELVGCDVLELVEDNASDRSEGLKWRSAGAALGKAIDADEKRVGNRYEACDVQVSAKVPGFFKDKELSQASLVDFSQDGVGLICNEKFSVNKKVKLSLEFSEGLFFELVGTVVRSRQSKSAKGRYLNGIKLDESVESFKNRVLEEGLRRKLR